MSELLVMLHENASDLHEAGIMDKQTMRKFDELCLSPVPSFRPDEIKDIREKEHVLQSVFAYQKHNAERLILDTRIKLD